MWYCPCGYENRDNDEYCQACGAPYQEPTISVRSQPSAQGPAAYPPQQGDPYPAPYPPQQEQPYQAPYPPQQEQPYQVPYPDQQEQPYQVPYPDQQEQPYQAPPVPQDGEVFQSSYRDMPDPPPPPKPEKPRRAKKEARPAPKPKPAKKKRHQSTWWLWLLAILGLLAAVVFICYFTVHEWLPATCTHPETCRFCGQTQGLPLGHSAAPADCTTPSICTRCGEELGPPLGHDPSAATCTEPSVCTRCGQLLENAQGHDWQAADYDRAETCSRCGKTRGKPKGWVGVLHGAMDEEILNLYGHGESCAYVLTEPVDRVFCLTLTIRVDDYSGDPFGTWGLYSLNQEGEWQELAAFELTESAYEHNVRIPLRLDGEFSLQALSLVAKTDADYTVDYAFAFSEVQQRVDQSNP